jgi:hypothetical protein
MQLIDIRIDKCAICMAAHLHELGQMQLDPAPFTQGGAWRRVWPTLDAIAAHAGAQCVPKFIEVVLD